MNGNPPKWADRFLRWYCNPDLLEEIQGDVYELFSRRAAKSKRTADIQFVWDVIRFCRLKNIRRRRKSHQTRFTSTAMIKSYFITGLRNIGRNLAPSLINISGLSIALACAITIFILIDSYYHLDTMHDKGGRIFLITNKVKGSDEPQHWANAPYKTGPALQQENPGVESVVRIEVERGISIRHESTVFNESIWFVDKNFFDVFDFPIVNGDRRALSDKSKVVIVEEMAKKYFGDEDPIGKTLSLKFSSGIKEEFTVGAVAESISDNSSMFFTFLIPMENMEDLKLIDTDSWKTFANSTFILFRPGHGPEELDGSLGAVKKLQNEANITWPISEFELIPLTAVAKRSYDMVNSLSWSNHPMAMISLGVIAAFLLLLACFNYMNVAVAAVATRLKEIGIRKVTGGGRKDIVNQFMIENLLLCAMGLAIGAVISYAMLVPAFNSLFSVHVRFSFSSAGVLIAFFGGILIFTAVLSGAYPSFYVASFNAVSILKGKEKFGSKSKLSKYLLTLQFVLSFTTIIACLVFAASSFYFEKLDWGYDYQQAVVIPVQSAEQFVATQNKAISSPHIVSHAGSASHVGKNSESATVRVNNENMNVTNFLVGFGYLETMNLRLNKGRVFDESIESDKDQAVVINDSFVKKMGWENPIGQMIEKDNKKLQVIGVISDFHHNDFYFRIEPMIFTIVPPEKFRYFVAKTEPSEVASVSEFLRANWKTSFPDDPYSGFQQMEVFEYVFRQNRETNKVFYFISSIALVLSCMGLYGLISYNLTRRLKEFSVRKIFGASIGNIFRLMNRDYLGIVLTAYVVGAPLGFYLMDRMLFAVYPYPLPFQLWPFIVTISLMTATVAITIAFQLRRVVNENPTVTLRND
jgi:putative ABC transport system permease protein